MKLLLDPIAYSTLQKQRHQSEEEAPLRLHGLIDQWARDRLKNAAGCASPKAILEPDSVVFTWFPTPTALIAASFGRLIYLHWGFGTSSRRKRVVLKVLLRRASQILVNDPTSAAEVQALAEREPIHMPMFVDTGYFTPDHSTMRGKVFFCAGSNDRDPTILTAMANAGLEVVWLCNDANLAKNAAREAPTLNIISGISFRELRHLYSTCAAAISPLARDLHAAGQTTGLEALACGAPLIISTGRAARVLEPFPAVRVVQGGIENWLSATRSALSAPTHHDTLITSARAVTKYVDPAAVMAALDTAFENVGNRAH